MNVETLARYEMKYAVHPAQLDQIRSVLHRYCVPDGFYLPEKHGWCSVDTLYFDSPDWRIFRASENQELVRVKLRVRTYPDFPDAVAKIEVKRRVKDQIMKASVVAPGKDWPEWLWSGKDLSALPVNTQRSLNEFLTLQRAMDARPRVLIRYQRQAFRSLYDDYVRITFDRDICHQPMEQFRLQGDTSRWQRVDDEGSLGRRGHLLMELKFRHRPPVWLADMVNQFGLVRQGFSKYCSAVRRSHMDWTGYWDMVPLIVPQEAAA